MAEEEEEEDVNERDQCKTLIEMYNVRVHDRLNARKTKRCPAETVTVL